MERDDLILTNPFAGSATVVTKCKDENRIAKEAFDLMLEELEVEDYNEFYILFTNGLLIKKGRSKFRSSGYIKGEHYERKTL